MTSRVSSLRATRLGPGLAAIAQILGMSCSSGGLRPSPGGRPESGPEGGPEAPRPLAADAFTPADDGDAAAVDASPNHGCGTYPPVPIYCCPSPEPLSPISPDDACEFALPVVPPNADNGAVYLDKNLVPKDPTNGWTYGAASATIVLTGTYCDQAVIDASPGVVQYVCGCPGLGAPPPCIP
jgi:hypothetical protein